MRYISRKLLFLYCYFCTYGAFLFLLLRRFRYDFDSFLLVVTKVVRWIEEAKLLSDEKKKLARDQRDFHFESL